MIYKTKYNPELTAIFKEEIIAAFSPSLISHDEEPTGVFSLETFQSIVLQRLIVQKKKRNVPLWVLEVHWLMGLQEARKGNLAA